MMRAMPLLLVALLSASPAVIAMDTVRPGMKGSSCNVEGPDARIGFRDDALVFERRRAVVASIGADYSLTVDGRPVALTPEQQFAVAAYRGGYDALMVEAKELGLAGAELGAKAAFHVIGALFSGRMAEFEATIEAETARIEARAASLCALAETLEQQHAELVVAVPEFGRALSN